MIINQPLSEWQGERRDATKAQRISTNAQCRSTSTWQWGTKMKLPAPQMCIIQAVWWSFTSVPLPTTPQVLRDNHYWIAFKLNARAQHFAQHLARLGTFQHGVGQFDGRGRVGENLAAGSPLSGAGAVDMWYREVGAYERSPGGFSMDTAHFTQVIGLLL